MVTVNTRRGLPVFRRRDVVRHCEKQLLDVAGQHGFDVLAYCFGFKRRQGQPLWQRSYYDHVLRREEDKEEMAQYIWNNPVRAGLVTSLDEYLFSGPR